MLNQQSIKTICFTILNESGCQLYMVYGFVYKNYVTQPFELQISCIRWGRSHKILCQPKKINGERISVENLLYHVQSNSNTATPLFDVIFNFSNIYTTIVCSTQAPINVIMSFSISVILCAQKVFFFLNFSILSYAML